MNAFIHIGLSILPFSVFFLLGHGIFLILRSKEEYKYYNKKKLCRAFGIWSFSISIVCLLAGINPTRDTWKPVLLYVIISLSVPMWYSYKKCKVKIEYNHKRRKGKKKPGKG